MEQQLIAFIDPIKFEDLFKEFGRETALRINFIKKYPDEDGKLIPSFLDNFKSVFYIRETSTSVSNLEQREAESALAILVTDNLSDFPYKPKKPFKVLLHGDKSSKNKVDKLKENDFYCGELQSKEEPSTPYGDLANALKEISSTGGSYVDIIKKILGEIPDYNFRLEAKLNLLHQCLIPQNNLETVHKYDFLSSDFEIFQTKVNEIRDKRENKEILWNDEEYIKALKELRIALLRS